MCKHCNLQIIKTCSNPKCNKQFPATCEYWQWRGELKTPNWRGHCRECISKKSKINNEKWIAIPENKLRRNNYIKLYDSKPENKLRNTLNHQMFKQQ